LGTFGKDGLTVKRLIALLLVGAFVTLSLGCGGGTSTKGSGGSTTPPPTHDTKK
jgi:hypothetical protein